MDFSADTPWWAVLAVQLAIIVKQILSERAFKRELREIRTSLRPPRWQSDELPVPPPPRPPLE